MISVYPSDEKLFSNNGLKILKPLKANIRKEDNGEYYIDLKDNLDNLQYYQEGMIIRVPTPWNYQCFRLNNPSIENNKVSVRGYHLYFDSKNYIIKDSYVVDKNCNEAMNHLNDATDIKSPFTVLSDISTINSYRCIRKSLEEAFSDVIDRWGGHLYRDNYNVQIRSKIGEDRGVVISYKKNLKNIKASENWDNVVTKILPVGKDGITLPEVYLELEEQLYNTPYTKVVSIDQENIIEDDFTDENGIFNEEEYETALIEDLRKKGKIYLEENKLPLVNYSVDAYLKDVSDIGDTIYVNHPKCNINLVTNVIALEYDCILQKYTKIEFGNFKSSLKNLFKDISTSVKEEATRQNSETKVLLEEELKKATAEIWSTLGNSYVIYDGDKILVVDSLPKEEATNVIMINSEGIGFSNTGINGTFNSAWTIDGTFDMQNINVINLVADMIKGGTLKLGGLNNTNGTIEIYDVNGNLIGKIDKNGFSFTISNTTTNIEEIIDSINDNRTNINENYKDIIGQLENYAKEDDLVELQNKVTETTTATERVTSIVEDIQKNGVSQVVTETDITLNKDGLSVDKTGAPTGSTLSEAGLEIKDKTGSNEETQFYSGYVDEKMAEKTPELEKYKGSTVTYSKNLMFEQYLSSKNWRIEEVTHSVFGKGLGFFYTGGED